VAETDHDRAVTSITRTLKSLPGTRDWREGSQMQVAMVILSDLQDNGMAVVAVVADE
jgi:hypothetical protein